MWPSLAMPAHKYAVGGHLACTDDEVLACRQKQAGGGGV